jgi:hypothetical protein
VQNSNSELWYNVRSYQVAKPRISVPLAKGVQELEDWALLPPRPNPHKENFLTRVKLTNMAFSSKEAFDRTQIID